MRVCVRVCADVMMIRAVLFVLFVLFYYCMMHVMVAGVRVSFFVLCRVVALCRVVSSGVEWSRVVSCCLSLLPLYYVFRSSRLLAMVEVVKKYYSGVESTRTLARATLESREY